jgi:hypothetical protein
LDYGNTKEKNESRIGETCFEVGVWVSYNVCLWERKRDTEWVYVSVPEKERERE